MLMQTTENTYIDLRFASESSMAFWDNPLDDEWNNARSPGGTR